MFSIYSDLNSKKLIDDSYLFENHKYFILLDEPENKEVETLFKQSSLKKHISWHPGNKVAELCFTNYIGLVRIFDQEFDIRSEKFDSKLSGIEQLELITNELDQISKKISFSYDSSLYNRSISDWESIENNNIHKLNYLYQVFFETKKYDQAAYQLEKIKRNSSQRYESEFIKKPVWKLKKITPHIIKQLAKNGFTKGKKKSDLRINLDEKFLSNNTPDNQFVRFFYEYCQQISLNVLTTKNLPDGVIRNAQKLLTENRRILSDQFFHSVDKASRISMNSTVLASRDGYNTLMKYFINSLFSVRHVFEEFDNELKVDLVDIATLYEMWCFYKLSYLLLGENILISEKTSKIKDDAIKYSTTFENKAYKVSYNRSFSIVTGESYSTTLRPDITVQDISSKALYHFDAKYRINSYVSKDDVEYKSVKNDDINKMHAYLDAIYNSSCSIVLYPGTNFKFFVRSITSHNIITNIESDFELKGVGAIPLVPGENNLILEKLINKFFNK